MRILVTGGAGMLGTSLLPILRSDNHTVLCTDINCLNEGIEYLDVRDLEQMVAVGGRCNPDILIHLAAETDLETCETRVDYAYQENFVGTQNACVLCRRLGIPIVYVSTAGVFDGTKESPYTEFDIPNPINIYGKSKLEGEHAVRQTIPEHYIVRAGWMIGGGERDKKFVSKIIHQIRQRSDTIYAVVDKKGTPTYAPAFSEILAKLIHTGVHGTYHIACKGSGSRFDVAVEIVRLLGRKDIEVKPVTSDFFNETYFAPRPDSEEMRNYILELRSKDTMPHWKDALATYLRLEFGDLLA